MVPPGSSSRSRRCGDAIEPTASGPPGDVSGLQGARNEERIPHPARPRTASSHVGSSSPHTYSRPWNALATYSNCASVGRSPPRASQKAFACFHDMQLTGRSSRPIGIAVYVQKSWKAAPDVPPLQRYSGLSPAARTRPTVTSVESMKNGGTITRRSRSAASPVPSPVSFAFPIQNAPPGTQTSPKGALPGHGLRSAPGQVPTRDGPSPTFVASTGASSDPLGTPTASVARNTPRSITPSLVTGSATVVSTTELGAFPVASGSGGSPESVARSGYMRSRTRYPGAPGAAGTPNDTSSWRNRSASSANPREQPVQGSIAPGSKTSTRSVSKSGIGSERPTLWPGGGGTGASVSMWSSTCPRAGSSGGSHAPAASAAAR